MRHVSVQQLSAFVDGALVGVSRELVTRHLTACAQCRERHAGWRANDDALRRVLAWEPDDRTLEEWSSRVEMTLMAERKGMPPPEFSERHHPVIGKAEPDSERLDIVVQSLRRTRRGAPPPKEPLPATVVPPSAEPVSAANDPTTPEPVPAAVVPPPEPAPVAAAEPAPAEPDAAARSEVGAAAIESTAEVAAPAPEPVAEAIASAPDGGDAAAGPAEPPVKTPPWSEIALPAARSSEPARAPEPEPAPAPVRAHLEFPPPRPRVLDAVPAADHFPDPPPPPLQQPPRLEVVPGIPALTGRPAPPNRRARPLLFLVSGLLLLVIAGSPLVPEVIRIPLPERWRWRLPRVEFVRRDHGVVPSVPAPATQLATSPTDVSVPVPPEPIAAPIDSHATRTGDGTSDPTPIAAGSEASPADALTDEATTAPAPSEAKPAAEKPRAKAESRTTKPTRSIVTERATPPRPAPKKTAPPRAEAEPEPPVTGVESPGTIIPATRVTTTVQAVPPPAQPTVPPAQPTPPPAPAPAPAQPAESEEDWPLLCGTVLDAAGAPVEGARVVLPANALTVRTDRRGRFCVACPPGTQGLRVEAAGHQLFSRTVELSTGMVEITISLTRSP